MKNSKELQLLLDMRNLSKEEIEIQFLDEDCVEQSNYKFTKECKVIIKAISEWNFNKMLYLSDLFNLCYPNSRQDFLLSTKKQIKFKTAYSLLAKQLKINMEGNPFRRTILSMEEKLYDLGIIVYSEE